MVIYQCFCFPNSQWGVTAHDTTYTGSVRVTVLVSGWFYPHW